MKIFSVIFVSFEFPTTKARRHKMNKTSCLSAFVVKAAEAGRYQDIGAGFDQVDAELPRDEGPEFDKLFIALDFWDAAS